MLASLPVTILLAEDEPMVRNMIATILKGHGYNVLVAVDGQDALEVTKTNQQEEINLLLTDIEMPKMNGLELVRQFRKECPEAKIILMSGFTEDPSLKDAKSQQNTEFISKPFSPQTLTQKVEEMLRRDS